MKKILRSLLLMRIANSKHLSVVSMSQSLSFITKSFLFLVLSVGLMLPFLSQAQETEAVSVTSETGNIPNTNTSVSVSPNEVTKTKVVTALSRNIYSTQFIQDGNKITLSFDLTNRIPEETPLKYAVALVEKLSSGEDITRDQFIYDEIITVTDRSAPLFRTVTYTIPEGLYGNFTLFLILAHDDDSFFSSAEVGRISFLKDTSNEVQNQVPATTAVESQQNLVNDNSRKIFFIVVVGFSLILLLGLFFLRKRNKKNTIIAIFILSIISSSFLLSTRAEAYSFSLPIRQDSTPWPTDCFDFASCFTWPEYNGPSLGTANVTINKTTFSPGETIEITSSIQSQVRGGYYEDFSLSCNWESGTYEMRGYPSGTDILDGINRSGVTSYGSCVVPLMYNGRDVSGEIGGFFTPVREFYPGHWYTTIGARGPVLFDLGTKTGKAPLIPGDYTFWFIGYAGYPNGYAYYTVPFTVTALPSYSCTGTIPANATLCSGDSAGLSADTPITGVNACTPTTKCEYSCNTGYNWNGSSCTVAPATPTNLTVRCTPNVNTGYYWMDVEWSPSANAINYPMTVRYPVSQSTPDMVIGNGAMNDGAPVGTLQNNGKLWHRIDGRFARGDYKVNVRAWNEQGGMSSATQVNVSCNQNIPTINGSCTGYNSGYPENRGCNSGIRSENPADTVTQYKWTCLGAGVPKGTDSPVCVEGKSQPIQNMSVSSPTGSIGNWLDFDSADLTVPSGTGTYQVTLTWSLILGSNPYTPISGSCVVASPIAGVPGWENSGIVKSVSGSETITLTYGPNPYDFYLNCQDSDGLGATGKTHIQIVGFELLNPTVDLTINDLDAIAVKQGDLMTIKWDSTNAISCIANLGAGFASSGNHLYQSDGVTEAFDGSLTNVSATFSGDYTITCEATSGATASDTVSVVVSCDPFCSNWSACSKSCGEGEKTRSCTGTTCIPYSETEACNTNPCAQASWREVAPWN